MINLKLSEKHIETISRAAAEAAIEHLEKERAKQEKEKHDRRLRNVKLLLKNYRSFAIHAIDIKLEINELDHLLDLDDLSTNEFAVMSIKRSKERTLAIVKYINKMLKVYRLVCEQSGNPEEMRRYSVIYELYISDEKKTSDEICEMHFYKKRTMYKDVDNACKTLAVLMFGVDGIRFKS